MQAVAQSNANWIRSYKTPSMASQTSHYSIFSLLLYIFIFVHNLYALLLHIFIFVFNLCLFLLYIFRFYSIFDHLYSISVHFYCIGFVFYSIFDHLYLIINDLYAIVFHYYSMTSNLYSIFFICILYSYCIIVIYMYIRYFHICI